MTSPRLELDDIIVGQSAKEVVVNGNNRRLEAWFGVKSRTIGGPPGSPTSGGDRIVGAGCAPLEQVKRTRTPAPGCRDFGLGHLHMRRQDRNPHREPDETGCRLC